MTRESVNLKNLSINAKRLKNSETAPDELSPGLPLMNEKENQISGSIVTSLGPFAPSASSKRTKQGLR